MKLLLHTVSHRQPSLMQRLLTFSVLFISITSCQRTFQPLERPESRPTPVSFAADSSQTGSITDQNWRTFFAEPDLVQIIDTALASNIDLQIAMQRIEQARAAFQYSEGYLFPQVNLAGSAGVDRFGRNTLNGVGNFDTNLSPNIRGNLVIPNPTPDYFLGARSTWEIDLWGKLRNRRKAAYTRFLASEEGRRLIVTSLVADIARYYYDLLSLDAELEILQKNINLQKRAVELVEVQKQAGRVTELAVQQFTAQLLNTQGRKSLIQQQIVATENAINRLLGRFPQPIARGTSLLDRELPGQALTGLPRQMINRRPDIRQAELELQAANIDIDVTRAAFLPSLNLNAYVGFNSYRLATLLDPASLTAGILGGLTAPVFNRRFLKADLRQSIAVSREAFYRYRQTVQTGFSEVVTSVRGIENYRNAADFQAQEVAVLRKAVLTSNDLLAGGYASYLEVITAQRSVLEAELTLISTKQSQFLALTDLYRALGGGWE